MSHLLEVKNLETGFQIDDDLLQVLHGVSFHVDRGEIVGVVGESGSGKSVTALSIMQLFHDTPGRIIGGEVLYEGENLLDLSERDMRKVRRSEEHTSELQSRGLIVCRLLLEKRN